MDAKLQKHLVDYSEGMGASRCKNCIHYMGGNVCEIVAGFIDPEYWCEFFEKRPSARRLMRRFY